MKFVLSILLLAYTVQSACSLMQDEGGEFLISNYSEFRQIGAGECTLQNIYRLTNDILATDSLIALVDSGFTSIGTKDLPFQGMLHGSGHIIQARFANFSGLFGNIDSMAVIDSLTVQIDSIETGKESGGLVGENHGLITQCTVRAHMNGLYDLGGIAGVNTGSIVACVFVGKIEGMSECGGLVGSNSGNILNSHALATLAVESTNAGGLAGISDGSIQQSYASVTFELPSYYVDYQIKNSSSYYVGGLVGSNVGTISESYASSDPI